MAGGRKEQHTSLKSGIFFFFLTQTAFSHQDVRSTSKHEQEDNLVRKMLALFFFFVFATEQRQQRGGHAKS